jgi:hypothetical protein
MKFVQKAKILPMMSIYSPSKHGKVISHDLRDLSGEQPTKAKTHLEMKVSVGERTRNMRSGRDFARNCLRL